MKRKGGYNTSKSKKKKIEKGSNVNSQSNEVEGDYDSDYSDDEEMDCVEEEMDLIEEEKIIDVFRNEEIEKESEGNKFTEEDIKDWTHEKPQYGYMDEVLKFMFLKCEYNVIAPESNKNGRNEVVLNVFGRTKEGYDVLCKMKGFHPYFYVEVTKQLYDESNKFINAFNSVVQGSKIKEMNKLEIVLCYARLTRKKAHGHDYNDRYFYQITAGHPQYVSRLRLLMEEGFYVNGEHTKFLTYESNIPFHIRCGIDSKLNGCCWIEIKNEHIYNVKKKSSWCDIEIEVHKNDIKVHEPQGEYALIAPVRIMSYDIEAHGRDDHFPNAELDDEVICISVVIEDGGDEKTRKKIVLAYRETAETDDCKTYWYKREEDLLLAFKDLVQISNPDMLTGYNISNFDNKYLFKRAAKLECDEFFKLSKLKNVKSSLKITKTYSDQGGSKETENATFFGRTNFDTLLIVKSPITNIKLPDYTLNTVAGHILKDKKMDLHYTKLPGLFDGIRKKDKNGNIEVLFEATKYTREKIARYCLYDSILPLNILKSKKSLISFVEMSRVVGISINDIVERGLSLRTYATFIRHCNEEGYLVPVNKTEKYKFQGANVFKPTKGLYTKPIATGDVTSMYPSLMIVINGCSTTYIEQERLKDYNREDYNTYEVEVRDKEGNYLFSKYNSFLKSHITVGICPKFVKKFLDTRSVVKKILEKEKDPNMIDILNGRQLALKLNANGTYGWIGASTNTTSCPQVSETITSEGRKAIIEAKEFVEKTFTKEKGCKYDTKVVYGDTDSIMIHIESGLKDEVIIMKDYVDFSIGMVKAINDHLQEIMNTTVFSMAWEKIYCPFLLIDKKMYSGLKYENKGVPLYIDTKGLANVRSSTTRMTKKLINEVLGLLFYKNDKKGVKTLIKNTIQDLFTRKIGLSDLIFSKKLNDPTQYKTPQPHTVLNEKIKKRGGNAYRVGDRVLYVILSGEKFRTKGKQSLIRDRAEDPLYACDNNLKVDYDYYLYVQIKKPILSLLKDVLKEPEKLFHGDHMNKKVFETPDIFQLSKFVKVIEKCLCCNKKLIFKEDNVKKIEVKKPIKKIEVSKKKGLKQQKLGFKTKNIEELEKVKDIEDMVKEIIFDRGPLCFDCEEKGLLNDTYSKFNSEKQEVCKKEEDNLKTCYKCQGYEGEVMCTNYNACDVFWNKRSNTNKIRKLEKTISRFKHLDLIFK